MFVFGEDPLLSWAPQTNTDLPYPDHTSHAPQADNNSSWPGHRYYAAHTDKCAAELFAQCMRPETGK